MSILNKRNAMLGWLAWAVAKRTMKRKAQGVVPGSESGGRSRLAFLPVIAAAVGGAVFFWRRQNENEDDEST